MRTHVDRKQNIAGRRASLASLALASQPALVQAVLSRPTSFYTGINS